MICMATAQSLLNQIDAAIESLLTGGAESYSIGNRTVTKLDLDLLMKQRNALQMQVERESGGGFRLAKLQRRSR